MPAAPTSPDTVPCRLRQGLFALCLLTILGLGGELLLIGHFEEWRQQAPMVLLAAGLLSLGWVVWRPSRASLRTWQGLMVLHLTAGVAGLWLHYQANLEFERELYPSLRGWALAWKAIHGTSPPALAPGAMLQLGLLGLAAVYQHPRLTAAPERTPPPP